VPLTFTVRLIDFAFDRFGVDRLGRTLARAGFGALGRFRTSGHRGCEKESEQDLDTRRG
jgi:hypothetical protein